ncbi:hypothetical protein [Streptomyces sp. NRRL B-24572]|uniref:hypothetical protein n=1 Tax=Streptomyces sp. NRRL B-24572 TaxID=1962156 RepID=UPI000A35F215|nr:hypothetical protein [Streptomyces sp. NRRL B-24572]
MTLTYTDLMGMDLGKLDTAVGDWKAMAGKLAKLETAARDGLLRTSEQARWKGVNADVTREFVAGTAKEIADLKSEATSIHAVLADAHTELVSIQKRAKALTEEAAKGSEKDPGLLVTDGGDGTVRVMEAMCTPEGTTQRTKDLMQWYADTLTGLLSHATEIDAAATRALKRSHGGDVHNAGHATYTSLDEDQLPRATKLASLGKGANDEQRAELVRLWRSLSPEARAELWAKQEDNLVAAGLLNPSMKQIAPDKGSGPYDVEKPGFQEWATLAKMRGITEGADAMDLVDAGRHMDHYLDNDGKPMNLPVDKMMADDDGFRKHIDGHIRMYQEEWREMALAEFKANGGKPVSIPVETPNINDYSFTKESNPNWFYAVGSTRANVTGVVTVVPDADGNPKVGLDYQANAWDRYNWDENKGVDIFGVMDIPDGQMARLHTTGLAQEFDMSGSSSVKHYDLGSSTPNAGPLPEPDEPGREGGRTDNGRETREGRAGTGR